MSSCGSMNEVRSPDQDSNAVTGFVAGLCGRRSPVAVRDLPGHSTVKTTERLRTLRRKSSGTPLIELVGHVGIEPTTNGLRVRCSTS